MSSIVDFLSWLCNQYAQALTVAHASPADQTRDAGDGPASDTLLEEEKLRYTHERLALALISL